MIDKFSISFVLLNILLLTQCLSAEVAAGGNEVNSMSYSISNSEFDPAKHKVHAIEVSNEIANPFAATETQLFFLVGNELHWVNEANAMVKLGRLVDFRGEKKNLNFVQIKASTWKNQIIFVADVQHNYYVYVISLPSKPGQGSTTPIIAPIQNLTKHGQARTISFLHFEQDLYCLLGSTAIAEKRSELRFLRWARSYFQVIETIMNRNHAIDMVIVSARQNLILIVHNKENADDDTTIQVHRYLAMEKAENEPREILTERVQDIFLPYELTATNMFFYSDTGSQRLYLITCNGPALAAVPTGSCEFYTWKRDGIAESTRFQRVQRFPLGEAIAHLAEPLQSISNDTNILNLDSVLAIQNGESVYAFHGQADSLVLHVPDMNSIGILLEKKLTPDAKSIAHNLIGIYREPSTQSGTIDITVRTLKLFEEKIPDATLNAANVMKSGDGTMTSGDIAVELSRIKELLLDLRGHLVSENEQFLKPMQSKITAMKEALGTRQALQSGTLGPEPISIFCSQVKITAPTETKVDAIILNADRNHMDASLANTYERLKKINVNPPSRAKRSTDAQETVHVRRLTIKSENHPFKGMLLKNSSSNTYRLNGKIKTHTLRVNRVSGNGTSDTILGETGNSHSKIQVKSINGADWDNFVSSLYRKGRNTPINGNIVLTHPTSIRRLFTNELNEVSPNDFLTIGTDQQIDSNIVISRIHVNDIQSNVINNMQRFAEYVAVIGRDNFVDTRVKISVCNISNSLQLSDKEGEQLTQHIVGTRMEDLSQIYNGRIIIKGSLSLQNVQLPSPDNSASPFAPIEMYPGIAIQPSAQILIDGAPFDLRSIPQRYWMKSLDQNFADVAFLQPITAPQLNADFLLSHSTDNYFVLSASKEPPNQLSKLYVVFQAETSVAGNLYSEDSWNTTLQQLSENAVRRGQRATLSSPIIFSDRLIVDDIVMLLDTDQFVRRNRPVSPTDPLFDGTVRKEFAGTVHIDNDLAVMSEQTAEITIDNFNDRQSLRGYFDNMVRIDDQQSVVGTLIFDGHLFANNFTVSAFIDNAGKDASSPYDIPFDVNNLLSEIFNLRENRIERMQLNGNVQFTQSNQLSVGLLNGLPLSDYLALVVVQQQSNQTIQIFGTKTFAGDVTIPIVSVSSFNREIYVDDWMSKSLRLQSSPGAIQVIDGGGWIIEKLVAENFEVRGSINGIRLPIKNHPAEFSDVIILDETNPQQPINIWSTLLFLQGMQIGPYADLSCHRIAKCDVNKLFAGDSVPLTHTNWDSVSVSQTAIIPPSPSAAPTKGVSAFFRDAVVSGADQVIGGSGRNITLKTNGKIVFNRIGTIATVKSQQPLINGVNLIDLYADAVTQAIVSVDGETQPILIEGQKEFLNEYVQLSGPQTICAENLNAKNMGGVDILSLNTTLIRQVDDNLSLANGHKLVFLKSPTIERLTIDPQATINGVAIEDIFFIYDKSNQPPGMAFARHDDSYASEMCVHVLSDLNLSTVNELSLKYFLDNRVRKYEGNGVPAADGSDQQLIYGHLTFENLVVSGSRTKIDKINDILCDDVVVASGDVGEQHISGFKEIVGDLNVYQPLHTWKINGIDVMSSYLRTVFLSENQTLEQLSIHEPYHLDATVLNVRNQINGIALPNDVDYTVGAAVAHSVADDGDTVAASLKIKKLQYIDSSNDFTIAFNPTDLFDAKNSHDVHRTWYPIDSFYSEMVPSAKGRGKMEESTCPVQYHIQFEESGSSRRKSLVVRRAAIGARLLTLTLNANYIVHIHTEFPHANNYYNKCNFKQLRRNAKPSSQVFINYKQEMTLPAYIESAHIFTVPQTKRAYLILHCFDKEVVIKRTSIDISAQKWAPVQTIPLEPNPARIVNVKLIEWPQRILVVAQSSPSNMHGTGAEHLAFYRFNDKKEKFEKSNQIDGDFNIISSIVIDQPPTKRNAKKKTPSKELHLILTKQGERTVQFWKADNRPKAAKIDFQFQYKKQLGGDIESLSIFAEYEVTYLSVIFTDGQFNVFQYRARDHAQDLSPVWLKTGASVWQKKMAGHFGAKAMVPFTINNKLYLLVFMNEYGANLQASDKGKANKKTRAKDIAKVFTLYYY